MVNGQRVAKNQAVVEVLGAIDELNATIGTLNLPLDKIQEDLMEIAAKIAGKKEDKGDRNLERKVKGLEREIDRMEKDLPKLTNFILPAGPVHLARAVCRRAERRVVAMREAGDVRDPGETLRYLNRLSDYLFVLARWENRRKKVPEKIWRR